MSQLLKKMQLTSMLNVALLAMAGSVTVRFSSFLLLRCAVALLCTIVTYSREQLDSFCTVLPKFHSSHSPCFLCSPQDGLRDLGVDSLGYSSRAIGKAMNVNDECFLLGYLPIDVDSPLSLFQFLSQMAVSEFLLTSRSLPSILPRASLTTEPMLLAEYRSPLTSPSAVTWVAGPLCLEPTDRPPPLP
jgi:hypothetical protein